MGLLLALCPPVPAAAEAARVLCTIRDPRITESSGLAASASALWTVDDGGSRLRVFQLSRSCAVTRTIDADIDPYDVEDLARAADGTLWLADTGDNSLDRSTVALERIRPDGSAALFRLTYPDGPHDAEALLLTPSGRVYIATKEPLSSSVYTPAGELSAARPTPLRKVASIALVPTGTAGGPIGATGQVLVTGGAVSADGRLVVLRTYTDAYVFPAPDGDVEAALRSPDRTRIALPATAQGEAVAVSADGKSLLTSTEGVPGAVHEVPLGAAAPTSGPSGSGPSGSGPSGSGPSGSGPSGSGTAAREPASGSGDGSGTPGLLRSLALPVLGVVLLGGLLSLAVSRRR